MLAARVRGFLLVVLSGGWTGGAVWTAAAAPGVDPPAIQLDGSIGPPGAEVELQGSTWQIHDGLGEYGANDKNLFFSFGRFNVPSNQTAEFSATLGTPLRVLARVTWMEPSIIEGTISSTIPGADIYLMNPAGVRFLGGGRVNVLGSFHATTAGRIDLGPAASFHASADVPPPLVTSAAPSAFGFLEDRAEAVSFVNVLAPLSVPAGKTLGAVGGRIDVVGGDRTVFSSPGSQIVLAAAGPGVEVPLPVADFDPSGHAPGQLGPVVVREEANVYASSPAGSIVVRGDQFELTGDSALATIHNGAAPSAWPAGVDIAVRDTVTISGGSEIRAGTISGGAAGDVHIRGDRVEVTGGSKIRVASFGEGRGSNLQVRVGSLRLSGGELVTQAASSGPGGVVDVNAGDARIELEGRIHSLAEKTGPGGNLLIDADALSLASGGRINSEATGSAPGGGIEVGAGSVDVSDAEGSSSGTFIGSNTFSTTADTAPGGDVFVEADRVTLRDGGQVFARTEGSSPGGAVTLEAGSLVVEGRGVGEEPPPSQVSTLAASSATGTGGPLSLTVDDLRVSDGAEILSITFGSGDAGDMSIDATGLVRVEGGPRGGSVIAARARPTEEGALVGAPGSIDIHADRLELGARGQISASTAGPEPGGSVDIGVDDLSVEGAGPLDSETGIFSQSLIGATGPAGALRVDADGSVELSDGGRISVQTFGSGRGGRAEVVAGDRISLSNGASIAATALGDSTGEGGSISVTAGKGVSLSGGAEIAARSFGKGAAGSIEIDAGRRLSLVDAGISTESRTRDNPGGGQIDITAREKVSLRDSSIDTSVALGGGNGGNVRIDPDVVALNRSVVLANAFDGNGGSIFIRAGAFVISTGSLIQAKSLGEGGGLDGTIVIESPEADLTAETTQLAQQYLDASGLLRTACGARGADLSSLVVTRVAGLPATPEGPLPAPLWSDEWLGEGRAVAGTPKPARDAPVQRLAALGSRCRNTETIQ